MFSARTDILFFYVDNAHRQQQQQFRRLRLRDVLSSMLRCVPEFKSGLGCRSAIPRAEMTSHFTHSVREAA